MDYWLTWVLVLFVLVLVALLIGMSHAKIRNRLGLEKKDIWLAILGILSILVTQMFAKAISESETRAKYVELGVGILRSEPKQKAENEAGGAECPQLKIDEEALRTWAYKLVDTYSDVPMDDVTRRALICRGLKEIIGTGHGQVEDITGSGTGTVGE